MKKKKSIKTSLVKGLLVLSVIGLSIPVLFVFLVSKNIFGPLPSKDELKQIKNESASIIYSEDGEVIGKVFAENRTNILFEDIPTHLIEALVATEDARFFHHEGVDSRSLVRVLIRTIILQDKSGGGGSTITQQLVKNFYGRKSFGPMTMPVNKTKEAILANRIEEVFTKEDIITLYLNTVPFGENVFGIESASLRYFNKTTSELNLLEGAALVGSLKANSYYNPHLNPDNAAKRRNVVLSQMVKYEYINQSEYDSLKTQQLELNYVNLGLKGPADYFLVQVKSEVKEILNQIELKTGKNYNLKTDGLVIKTTLNAKLQSISLNSMKRHMHTMQGLLRKQYKANPKELNVMMTEIIQKKNWNNRIEEKVNREVIGWNGSHVDSMSFKDSLRHSLTLLHAGLLALQSNTGAIKVYVGGMDFRSQPFDQVRAKRQLASTFKPILYTAALETGIKPCDYLNNDALVLSDFNNWSPSNYDHSEGGEYSVAASLAKSMNIPTVRLYFETGFDQLDSTWTALGFSSRLKNTPSVALGIAETNLLELAQAYSAFANGGFLNKAYSVVSVSTSSGEILYERPNELARNSVMKPETSNNMNAMLTKAVQEGTGTSMRNKFGVRAKLAGKTGTSQNYSDAWFACYNSDLTWVTRVGASSPKIRFNTGAYGAGSTLALPNIGLAIREVEKDKELTKKYFSNSSAPNTNGILIECEDYIEESKFENFLEKFKNEETTLEKQDRKGKKKRKKRKRKS
ncbi:MAG: transglycosylase domain-containing protein [Salibacteraceae bacterium]